MLLLEILFITILILWIARILFLRLLPYLMAKLFVNLQKKAQASYQQGYGYNNQAQNHHQYQNRSDYDANAAQGSGKVKIDYVPPQAKRKANTNKGGEFVDFEEI